MEDEGDNKEDPERSIPDSDGPAAAHKQSRALIEVAESEPTPMSETGKPGPFGPDTPPAPDSNPAAAAQDDEITAAPAPTPSLVAKHSPHPSASGSQQDVAAAAEAVNKPAEG